MSNYLLSDVRIASPCPASWDKMTGDDRKRFCGQCKLHVYNLSAMAAPEAEALLQKSEGRLCVRLYRRRDGTVLTRDCPVGFRRRVWRGVALLAGSFAAVVAFLLATGSVSSAQDDAPVRGFDLDSIVGWIKGLFGFNDPVVMGEICVEPPPAAPQ